VTGQRKRLPPALRQLPPSPDYGGEKPLDVAVLLPFVLPAKSLTIKDVADVAGVPDLSINLVFLGLLNRNPNLNLETGNLACFVRV
jgi:hypothetical protein